MSDTPQKPSLGKEARTLVAAFHAAKAEFDRTVAEFDADGSGPGEPGTLAHQAAGTAFARADEALCNFIHELRPRFYRLKNPSIVVDGAIYTVNKDRREGGCPVIAYTPAELVVTL